MIKKDKIKNGPKGTSELSLYFFLKIKSGIATIAPIQKAKKTKIKFCKWSSIKKDKTKTNFQSAKPMALPWEKNHKKKKGDANNIDCIKELKILKNSIFKLLKSKIE